MKTLLITILLLSTQLAIAQYKLPDHTCTGIAKIDSLIAQRNRLVTKSINPATGMTKDPLIIDIILWYDYQIDRWKNGRDKRYCMYYRRDSTTFIGSCGITPQKNKYYIRDTFIYQPLPINYPGFMNWKADVINNQF